MILLNLYVTFRVIAKERKTAAMNQVLEEIDTIASEQESMPPALENGYSETGVRVANLKAFFRKHSSPLYEHAETIVKTSDKYGLDYRLIPAIAMQESTLCRAIPNNSHNCWGWGIYGNTVTRFPSYDVAIDTVARGLKKNYIDRGLITASQIMAVYTPSSNGSWARAVNSVMQYLE